MICLNTIVRKIVGGGLRYSTNNLQKTNRRWNAW